MPVRGDRGRGRDLPETGTIDLDGEDGEFTVWIQAIRIGEAIERDRPIVHELGATRDVDSALGGRHRPLGKLGHLRPAAGRHVDRHDLLGLLARGAGPLIGEGDLLTVRAEDDGGNRKNIGRGGFEVVGTNAAGGADLPRAAAAVDADKEEPLLLRRETGAKSITEVVRRLEDDARAIRANREALNDAAQQSVVADACTAEPGTSEPAGADVEWIRYLRAAPFPHHDRIAVAAPDDYFPAPGGESLCVAAFRHHVGEGPDARARGGARAPLGAGRPAISAPLAAAGTRLLARLQLPRAGALARCRGTSSWGRER